MPARKTSSEGTLAQACRTDTRKFAPACDQATGA